MLLSEVNVGRHLLEGVFLVDALERGITFQTSGENVEVFQTKGAQHLLDLLFVIAAFDEQASRIVLTFGQAGIPRQDDAILGPGNADDLIIFVLVRVRDVEAQHAQPPCELAHHHVGDEPDFVHFLHGG